jgi:hypothetical protein
VIPQMRAERPRVVSNEMLIMPPKARLSAQVHHLCDPRLTQVSMEV